MPPGPTDDERRKADTVTDPKAVRAWENFFNADDKRSQLVSRYIFDHMFLATVVLDESQGDYFKIVRSKTRQGTRAKIRRRTVEVIDTPFPYTDPFKYAGVDRLLLPLEEDDCATRTEEPFRVAAGPCGHRPPEEAVLRARMGQQRRSWTTPAWRLGTSATHSASIMRSRSKRAIVLCWRIPS